MESMEEKNGKACVAEEWKREYAEESILKAEEKRWSRRWRDALSWFISNGNKLGISPPACLICEYAEHPTPDSSPLIKAWLEAQVAIAHLYENTWWWLYTASSFRMELMCQSRADAEEYTHSHNSAYVCSSFLGFCLTCSAGEWNRITMWLMHDRSVGKMKFSYISFIFKLSAKMVPDHMVYWYLTLLINETNVFMQVW